MDHVAEWDIRIYLFEHDDDSTLARVVLKTGANTLHAEGLARRNPADAPAPEIGDELAVGRALIDLGNQLMATAGTDIEALAGRGDHDDR
jgi:Domain of unknown function (DUF1876)